MPVVFVFWERVSLFPHISSLLPVLSLKFPILHIVTCRRTHVMKATGSRSDLLNFSIITLPITITYRGSQSVTATSSFRFLPGLRGYWFSAEENSCSHLEMPWRKFVSRLTAWLSLSLIIRPTVSRPVCLGIKHPFGLTTRFLLDRNLRVCWCGAPSLTRDRVCRLQLLLALAKAVIFGSKSRVTCDHILLSQIRDFHFRRLLRLAGLRWRYSTLPPLPFYTCWAPVIEDSNIQGSLLFYECVLSKTCLFAAMLSNGDVFPEPLFSNRRLAPAFRRHITIFYCNPSETFKHFHP
jgi:hypothetical protein